MGHNPEWLGSALYMLELQADHYWGDGPMDASALHVGADQFREKQPGYILGPPEFAGALMIEPDEKPFPLTY